MSLLPPPCSVLLHTPVGPQAEARARFDAFVADPTGGALPSEYQQAVYKLVLAAGGEAEFDTLLKVRHHHHYRRPVSFGG